MKAVQHMTPMSVDDVMEGVPIAQGTHLSALDNAAKIICGQVSVKWKEKEIIPGSTGYGHCQALLPCTAYHCPKKQSVPGGKKE
eukprot:9773879-Karenia_brevis.AAC.1